MSYFPHSFLIEREDLRISTLNRKINGAPGYPEDFIKSFTNSESSIWTPS